MVTEAILGRLIGAASAGARLRPGPFFMPGRREREVGARSATKEGRSAGPRREREPARAVRRASNQ